MTCPGCGYNLTGVCTPTTPEGRCPECGVPFRRVELLKRQRERESFPTSSVVVQLLLFPVLLACMPMCCGIGSIGLANGYDQFETPVFILTLFVVPVVGAALIAWLIAWQAYPGRVAGIVPGRRRGILRHISLMWLLFFVIELVLTGMYLFGGCAAMIGLS